MLLDKTWYQYNSSGNVRRIINSEEGSDLHTATRFDYAHNGMALAYVVGETWDAARSCGTYTITHAREFRYDSGRQRYLDRELDPAQMELWNYSIVGETWTDYDGDQPYGDFTLSGINVTNARSFEPGMATVDPWTSSGSANTSFYHTNQVGSTRMMSDSGGAATGRAAHTAFGERISGTNHRYGYAGAYGYQQHDEFPYMHVGARYYDPATGRFLQRDPIGIGGGLNVYGYVRNSPTVTVDPSGRDIFQDIHDFIDGMMNGYIMGCMGAGTSVAGASNFKWKLRIGRRVNRATVALAGAWIGWNAGKLFNNYIGRPYFDWAEHKMLDRPPRRCPRPRFPYNPEDRSPWEPSEGPSNCCIHSGRCRGHGRG